MLTARQHSCSVGDRAAFLARVAQNTARRARDPIEIGGCPECHSNLDTADLQSDPPLGLGTPAEDGLAAAPAQDILEVPIITQVDGYTDEGAVQSYTYLTLTGATGSDVYYLGNDSSGNLVITTSTTKKYPVGSLSGIAIASGTFTILGNTDSHPEDVKLPALTIESGATLRVDNPTTHIDPAVVDIQRSPVGDHGLTIGSTGSLNLGGNALIVRDGTADLATIVGYIEQGRTGGYGITISGDAGYVSALAIGYIRYTNGTAFCDQPVSSGDVVARATFMGDCNLDGTVGSTDLGDLATYYGTSSGATWYEGDFDYNGTVDVSDLADMASSYGLSL